MENEAKDRLSQQMAFVIEVDKIKAIIRRNRVLHGDRHENSAEHSWHLALMAIVLAEYAQPKVDVLRVVKMLLIYDLVEIDAGDTFAYDTAAVLTQRDREVQAAERIFGLLPTDMEQGFRHLWDEFEAHETPEAKFAKAMDHMGGVLPGYVHDGGSWREAGVTVERVKDRNSVIADGSPRLWEYAEGLIDEVRDKGFLISSE